MRIPHPKVVFLIEEASKLLPQGNYGVDGRQDSGGLREARVQDHQLAHAGVCAVFCGLGEEVVEEIAGLPVISVQQQGGFIGNLGGLDETENFRDQRLGHDAAEAPAVDSLDERLQGRIGAEISRVHVLRSLQGASHDQSALTRPRPFHAETAQPSKDLRDWKTPGCQFHIANR